MYVKKFVYCLGTRKTEEQVVHVIYGKRPCPKRHASPGAVGHPTAVRHAPYYKDRTWPPEFPTQKLDNPSAIHGNYCTTHDRPSLFAGKSPNARDSRNHGQTRSMTEPGGATSE